MGPIFLPEQFRQRLTKRANEALVNSAAVAARYPFSTGNSTRETHPLHLLYALALQHGALARTMLSMERIPTSRLLTLVKRKARQVNKKGLARHTPSASQPFMVSSLALPAPNRIDGSLLAPRLSKGSNQLKGSNPSIRLQKILKRSLVIAMEYGQPYVGTEHLLYAILEGPSAPLSANQCKKLKIQLDDLFSSSQRLSSLASHAINDSVFPPPLDKETRNRYGNPTKNDFPELPFFPEFEGQDSRPQRSAATKSALQSFCEDLVSRAEKNEIDPLIGRETEMDRLIRILLRRTKNNPLILGDPGVGKTALVNGLAQKIVAGCVPHTLLHKRIYSLDLSSFIADTMFRGEFEGRMRDLLKEAANEDVILFIDEIHTIIGAGGAQGSLDAANILKPALARGTIRCIGATTFEEYKKYIEKDRALERRFQIITINEETSAESVQTLNAIKPLYEEHHNVRISPKAINAAVEFSVRYVYGRALPDKAIDLLDEAASRVRSRTPQVRNAISYISALEREKTATNRKKEEALFLQQYQKAVVLKNHEMELTAEITKLKKSMGDRDESAYPIVTEDTIREVVSESTGIPIERLDQKDRARFLALESELDSAIVGQKEAVKTVASILRRNKSGIQAGPRPLGSFLFVGPSGVGKTELAKILARTLSPKHAQLSSPPNLITLDMSEYSEPHSVSRLIGSPPGYVGHEEGGQLTDRVHINPYSIILFDEIEKAHPAVLHTLLQILDEGALTDAHGKRVNFSNTIIILTSNIGTERWFASKALGFTSDTTTTMEAEITEKLKEFMRPEVLNRIDHVVLFRPLDEKDITAIVGLQIASLQKHLAHSVQLTVEASVIPWLAKKSDKPEQGARAVRKIIEDHIESPLAVFILEHDPATVHVGLRKGEIMISKTKTGKFRAYNDN
ncbi:MAG: ATP-dependent Clp protease ATP-binding subunit [Candidatus Spechtbacteria bacterium]|nr:ATP-dependent Clp protease ATP-binding subunit [Candidatus Spechtbacteria bacterium]